MRDLDSSCVEGKGGATFMYPVIQHSTIGLRREEEVVVDLLTSVPWRDIHLSSPYSSYTPVMASALTRAAAAGANITLSSSSRSAHGFHGARGLKALVPEMHDMMLADFMDAVGTSHNASSVDTDTGALGGADISRTGYVGAREPASAPSVVFRQYTRPGWTFHAKGMWLNRHGVFSNPAAKSESNGESEGKSPEQQVPGAVFYIGSSNGGYRSWTRDFELGFLVATGSSRVCGSFQRELLSMEQFAPQVARREEVLARIEHIAWKRHLLSMLRTFL
jgi:CDP-diacylglycerol--glycerol-3-phosphate 3-phosphatidyltransferase